MKLPKEISKQHYREAKHAAIEFATALSGDVGFTNHEVNLIALEAMIQGWIAAQPWFRYWSRALVYNHKRDNPYVHLGDWALQIASDVIGKRSKFVALFTNKVSVYETALDRHIRRTKKKLGYVI